jgi:hypothetical protein
MTVLLGVVALSGGITWAGNPDALSGAIFTTVEDGSRVNANIYESLQDVYLDGGPGINAPVDAAGLPMGDYYFQVTDPSGHELLSSDHISCRMVHVNEYGVISHVYPGTNYEWQKGHWEPVPCQHEQGVDIDHADEGAITVQLFPYDKTPNNGGVYKAWMTPVDEYIGDPNLVPEHHSDWVNGEGWAPGDFHGFVPSHSKTDNYKAKPKPHDVKQYAYVLKFHDANGNFVFDEGDAWVDSWSITITEPIQTCNDWFTPVDLCLHPGIWTIEEDCPVCTLETVVYVNDVMQSHYPDASPSVTFEVPENEDFFIEIEFGNIGLGQVEACKAYDRDGDGVADPDEPWIKGWQMQIEGINVFGEIYGPAVQTTGADGCTVFADLVPGEYTVTELIPSTGGWTSTGATSQPVTIVSLLEENHIFGSLETALFTNYCEDYADFDTKGYWHNKNGLSELTEADVVLVNVFVLYV